jgi:hypothetical protein
MMAKTLHGSNGRHGWCALLEAFPVRGSALCEVAR